jgi:hypothetical protein
MFFPPATLCFWKAEVFIYYDRNFQFDAKLWFRPWKSWQSLLKTFCFAEYSSPQGKTKMQSCVLELVPSCDVVITLWTAVVSPKAPFAWAQLFSLCLFRALTTFFWTDSLSKSVAVGLVHLKVLPPTTTTPAAAADCYLWLLPLTTYRWLLLQVLLCFYCCLNSVYISASQVHFKTLQNSGLWRCSLTTSMMVAPPPQCEYCNK